MHKNMDTPGATKKSQGPGVQVTLVDMEQCQTERCYCEFNESKQLAPFWTDYKKHDMNASEQPPMQLEGIQNESTKPWFDRHLKASDKLDARGKGPRSTIPFHFRGFGRACGNSLKRNR